MVVCLGKYSEDTESVRRGRKDWWVGRVERILFLSLYLKSDKKKISRPLEPVPLLLFRPRSEPQTGPTS